MRNFFKFFMAMVAVSALATSCDKIDEGDFPKWYSYVTLNELTDGYYFTADDERTIYPGRTTRYPNYDAEGKNGDRVFIYFNKLEEAYEDYDLNIDLFQIINILSKSVEPAESSEDLEEFGDDGIDLTKAALTGGWLDVSFQVELSYSSKHKISLIDNKVDEAPKSMPEGYQYLELRHLCDSLGSLTYVQDGFVSYKLGRSYDPEYADTKGLYVRYKNIDGNINYLQIDYDPSEDEDDSNDEPVAATVARSKQIN